VLLHETDVGGADAAVAVAVKLTAAKCNQTVIHIVVFSKICIGGYFPVLFFLQVLLPSFPAQLLINVDLAHLAGPAVN
jgi:hypothetical protein